MSALPLGKPTLFLSTAQSGSAVRPSNRNIRKVAPARLTPLPAPESPLPTSGGRSLNEERAVASPTPSSARDTSSPSASSFSVLSLLSTGSTSTEPQSSVDQAALAVDQFVLDNLKTT